MGILGTLAASLGNTVAPLSPTLPLIPLVPVTTLATHLAGRFLDPTSLPYFRFPVIHGARVAIFWAGLTKHEHGLTRLADILAYLLLAWGGPTTVAFMLGSTPSWLLSPNPWLLYLPVYFCVRVTGLADYVGDKPITNFISAFVDGFTRSSTVCTIPVIIARDAPKLTGNVWASSVLGGFAISAGGWIVDGFSMTQSEWKLKRLTQLSGWPFDSLEFWGPALTGFVYAALVRSSPDVEPLTRLIVKLLPEEVLLHEGLSTGPIVTEEIARVICALFFGCLLASRVIVRLCVSSPTIARTREGYKAADVKK